MVRFESCHVERPLDGVKPDPEAQSWSSRRDFARDELYDVKTYAYLIGELIYETFMCGNLVSREYLSLVLDPLENDIVK